VTKRVSGQLQRVLPWLHNRDYALLAGSPHLFDTRFYLLLNPDVAEAGEDPVRHYLRRGADEARNPSAVFNTLYYRRTMPRHERWMNPLAHFLRYGAARGISPTPFFDPKVYGRRNRDVAESGSDLFEHYARYGVHENRVASDMFDPQRYLAETPEAKKSDLNALAHYLCEGEARGAAPMHHVGVGERKADGTEIRRPPDLMAEIRALPPQGQEDRVLDVIVPVYRAYEETLSCLWHVLRSRGELPFELVVVDDCAPEPELSAALQDLADSGHVTLLRNETNLGFVKSVNRGMRLHPDRDVILLNSDTEVYQGWADRLHATAMSDPLLGTLTPLTNNGTICSYPHFAEDNPFTLEIDYETLDGIAREVNAAAGPVPAPTAVGFAMYIKRAVIETVGYFDEAAFGTGYGEENDFCQRAQAAGWLDKIASNVVIRHLGSMSFQEQKAGRIKHAMGVIEARYPSYATRVQRFIASDPVRAHRARIDAARLDRCVGARNVLVISHNRGGGTEQFIAQENARMAAEGTSVFRMRADSPRRDRVMHFHVDAPDLPNLPPLDLEADRDAILALWQRLGIERVDIHHVADFGRFGARKLLRLLEGSGLPWRYVVHDYLAICPRINLADMDGTYCGEPDSAGCRRCLLAQHSEFGVVDIDWWRAENGRLLTGAEACVVPDRDVAERLARYWPDLPVRVQPHEEVSPGARRVRAGGAHRGDRELRVGVIGAISDIKGYRYLLECAAQARRRRWPIRFVVVGYTKDDRTAAHAGVEVTGPYRHEDVFETLEAQAVDVIFLPSRWPETYSYTLSVAIESGLPIIVFDIGALQARRPAGASAGHEPA
jgi:GT2 family glycosyltransferase